MRNRWFFLLLLLFCSACGIFKKRSVTKTDSIFIDKTKIITERVVDTVITLKSDTIKFSFSKPMGDTSFVLYSPNGGKVKVVYADGIYSIAAITKEKSVPIRITEKKVEYRNIYVRDKDKKVEVKKINYDWLSFLIISIIVIILVLKSNLKKYVQTKIKFW